VRGKLHPSRGSFIADGKKPETRRRGKSAELLDESGPIPLEKSERMDIPGRA